MNLFKHIANILALWTIPYVISFFYNLLSLITYMAMGDDFDSIKVFKTN